MAPSARRLGLTALLLLPPADVHAQTRLLRQFAEESGLVPPVWAIGQDRSGFLWIGAQGGLLRYDGNALHRLNTGSRPLGIISLDFHASGRVAAVSELGDVFEVRDGQLHDLAAPGEPGPRMLRMVAYDADGGLWTVRGRELWRHDTDNAWRRTQPDLLGGEPPLMVRSDGGRMLVSTSRGVWRTEDSGRAHKIIDADGIVDMAALEDGVVALRGSGHLFEWSAEGGPIDTFSIPKIATTVRGARPVALALRERTLWVAFDRFLVAVREDRSLDVLSSHDGIDGGGPLFVDREGSLWMGTFSALMQFPEPDTRVWTERQGLPSRHVRFLARAGDNVWVSSWQGLGRIYSTHARTSASTVSEWFTQERLCTQPRRSTVWATSRRGYVEIHATGRTRLHPLPGLILGCAPARSGGLWIASTTGLLHVSSVGGGPRPFPQPPPDTTSPLWEVVLEDRRGRLWAARDGRICDKDLLTADAWRCRGIGETGKVTGMVQLPSGAIWLSSMKAGVMTQRTDGEWEELSSNRELPTGAIFGLIPSASGGVWVVGHGVAQRVVEAAHGWEVVERLGPWNGLPAVGAADLLEDNDSTLWITSAYGVVEVPSRARFARAEPPAVAVVEAAVDGAPLDASRSFDLSYEQNRLELRFAALSFRDPGLVRYQIRLPTDERWQDTRGSPSFRWADLRPGEYDVQFRASLDGREWSAVPAVVRFSVHPPWYRQPWALAAYALLLGAVVFSVHRARVSVLLGLERQRTRIAMDLHDEIGSGLGSIGILAGVLSGSGTRSERGPPRERHLAREIAQTSEQLGEALSDIVWALDPKTASLQELALRLAEHGHRLCSAERGPEFSAELPDEWPARDLSIPVRRNVLAIGLEALHNAARHAHAEHVVLRLRAVGSRWEMLVEDDGSGIPAESARPDDHGHTVTRSGRGLPGMHRRADEIGAALSMHSANGKGTGVRLRFQLS